MIGGAMIALSLVNTAIGAYKNYETMKRGKEMAAEQREAIENYQRAERENVYRGLRAPTDRTQLSLQRTERDVASAIDATSRGGVAAYGVLPQLIEQGRSAYDDTAAAFEKSKMDIQRLIASDDARLQQMKFQEENMDLNALQQSYSSALQMEQQGREGMWGAVQSGVGSAGQLLGQQQEMDLMSQMYGVGKYTPKGLPEDVNRSQFNTGYRVGAPSKKSPMSMPSYLNGGKVENINLR